VIANQFVDANPFDLTGRVRINYSSSSIRGVPLVSYEDADDVDFTDDDIARIQTSKARWAPSPCTTGRRHIPTFTLFVSSTRLPPRPRVEFTTLAFETTDRSGAFVPAPALSGVRQTYQGYQFLGNGPVRRVVVAHLSVVAGRAEERFAC
jgi:hypothetical protein